MKILRIRRGFTTNSSGGNEWVPPKDVSVQGASGVAAGGIAPGEQPVALSRTSLHVTILATQPPATSLPSVAVTPATQQPARNDRSSSNLGLLGVLLGVVCLLFVVVAAVKRVVARRGAQHDR